MEEEATQERERAILPLPVKRVDGVSVETWTVKQWFQKINEELDELKEAVLSSIRGDADKCNVRNHNPYEAEAEIIADEAADTITALTSMLEAMGIDEQARQAAQERVNRQNKERGRY